MIIVFRCQIYQMYLRIVIYCFCFLFFFSMISFIRFFYFFQSLSLRLLSTGLHLLRDVCQFNVVISFSHYLCLFFFCLPGSPSVCFLFFLQHCNVCLLLLLLLVFCPQYSIFVQIHFMPTVRLRSKESLKHFL